MSKDFKVGDRVRMGEHTGTFEYSIGENSEYCKVSWDGALQLISFIDVLTKIEDEFKVGDRVVVQGTIEEIGCYGKDDLVKLKFKGGAPFYEIYYAYKKHLLEIGDRVKNGEHTGTILCDRGKDHHNLVIIKWDDEETCYFPARMLTKIDDFKAGDKVIIKGVIDESSCYGLSNIFKLRSDKELAGHHTIIVNKEALEKE